MSGKLNNFHNFSTSQSISDAKEEKEDALLINFENFYSLFFRQVTFHLNSMKNLINLKREKESKQRVLSKMENKDRKS